MLNHRQRKHMYLHTRYHTWPLQTTSTSCSSASVLSAVPIFKCSSGSRLARRETCAHTSIDDFPEITAERGGGRGDGVGRDSENAISGGEGRTGAEEGAIISRARSCIYNSSLTYFQKFALVCFELPLQSKRPRTHSHAHNEVATAPPASKTDRPHYRRSFRVPCCTHFDINTPVPEKANTSGICAPVLFYFVLFYWHVPPPLPLAVCLLHTGKLVVRGPHLYTLYFILYFLFRPFSPRIACRGERGAPLLVPILLFLVFYRPADPWGSILFWYTFSRYVSL